MDKKVSGWRSLITPLLVFLVTGGLLTGAGWLFLGNASPTTGSFITVRRSNISAVIRTTGKIEPVRQQRLAFRASDAVNRILVKPGDVVTTGTLLMELDTANLEKQLTNAQAQREATRFNLASQAEKGQNITELYAAARQLEQAENAVATAKTNLENARLFAPFDGTVLTVDTNVGENVGFAQAVLTLADFTRFQVRAEVDEIDIGNIALGQTAQFTLDAFPGRSFEGKVILVSPNPIQRQGSTIYPTLVSFEKPPELGLRNGMAANVIITSLNRSGVLVVANRAIENIGLRKYVTRRGADGNLEKVAVETGLTNADQSEIIGGLAENDQILLPR